MENKKDLQKNTTNIEPEKNVVVARKKPEVFKPHAEPKTGRMLIVLVLLVALFLGGLIFFCSSIRKNTDELISKRNIYEQELANSQSLNEIQKQLVLAENTEEFFEGIYIDATNALEFVTFLEQLAVESNVILNIQSLNSSVENEASGNNDYEFIEMTLNFNGDWDSVNNFLLMIENLPHHVMIGELKINRIQGSAESETPVWSVSMNLEAVAK